MSLTRRTDWTSTKRNTICNLFQVTKILLSIVIKRQNIQFDEVRSKIYFMVNYNNIFFSIIYLGTFVSFEKKSQKHEYWNKSLIYCRCVTQLNFAIKAVTVLLINRKKVLVLFENRNVKLGIHFIIKYIFIKIYHETPIHGLIKM